MIQKNYPKFISAVLISSALVACKKKEVLEDPCEINFLNLTRINQPLIMQSPSQLAQLIDSSSFHIDGKVCTSTEYEWAPGYDEPLLLSPNSAIFPGAIMGANTLTDGGYSIITGDRSGLVLSTSFQNLSGDRSVRIPKASLSEVRNGIKDLLQGNIIGPTSANIAVSTSRVYNESSLKSALSVAVDVVPGTINATFDWSSNSEKNRLVARFTQVYYTIDIDLPANPRDFWNTCPGKEVFGGQVPVVVSSVKYGRSAILTIESKASIDSLEAAVDLALKRVNVQADLAYKNIINNSTFNLTVLGGNAEDAVNINDFDGLRAYVQNGANYSEDNPAEPLSYKLKFLDDYSDAYVILYSKFNVRNCEVVGINQVTVPAAMVGPLYPVHRNGPGNFNSSDINTNISSEVYIDPTNSAKLILETNWNLVQERGFMTSDVEADVTNKKVIYTAPTGKKIVSINSDNRSYVNNQTITESMNNYHWLAPYQSSSTQELVDQFKLKFHTSQNPDFLSYGTSGCNGYVYLNDIIITLQDL